MSTGRDLDRHFRGVDAIDLHARTLRPSRDLKCADTRKLGLVQRFCPCSGVGPELAFAGEPELLQAIQGVRGIPEPRLDEAARAMVTGDVVAMLRIYQSLKEYEA